MHKGTGIVKHRDKPTVDLSVFEPYDPEEDPKVDYEVRARLKLWPYTFTPVLIILNPEARHLDRIEYQYVREGKHVLWNVPGGGKATEMELRHRIDEYAADPNTKTCYPSVMRHASGHPVLRT